MDKLVVVKNMGGRTGRTDGPGGRTGRTDRAEGPGGRTGRKDRAEGAGGRTEPPPPPTPAAQNPKKWGWTFPVTVMVLLKTGPSRSLLWSFKETGRLRSLSWSF